MRSTTIDSCSVDQLKRLLELAAPVPATTEGLELPGDLAFLARDLADCGRRTDALAMEQALEAVCAPAPPLELLDRLKADAKALLSRARTDRHRDAATLLYHLAVAAAWAAHGARISSVPVDARRDLFEELSIVLVDDRLASVFRRAADRLDRDERPGPGA